jgi:peptidoglycan/LPS O-acetylase OafA/YrhL
MLVELQPYPSTTKPSNLTRRYFPNLNGIRSLAAFMVMFHHIEQAKEAMGIPNIYHLNIIKHTGRLGVGLFFVLSGFLITYLLLQEKRNYGILSTQKFYFRRFFRIWPIYFLIIALSYLVFPYFDIFSYPGTNEKLFTNYGARLFLLTILLPNYAFVLFDLPYWFAQTWSIGVEEQFYYLWPWVIKYPKFVIPIFVFFICLTFGLLYVSLKAYGANPVEELRALTTFIGQFRIQIMAVGGFFAYLVINQKQNILIILYRRDVQITVYFVMITLFISGIHFPGFMEVYSIFFGFFILNLSSNPASIFTINSRFMSYSGKISYGLYLYHVVVLIIVLNLLKSFTQSLSGLAYNLILYIFVFLFSIILSSLLFEFLEKPLLRYKDKHYGR